jgi:hypothetical protein
VEKLMVYSNISCSLNQDVFDLKTVTQRFESKMDNITVRLISNKPIAVSAGINNLNIFKSKKRNFIVYEENTDNLYISLFFKKKDLVFVENRNLWDMLFISTDGIWKCIVGKYVSEGILRIRLSDLLYIFKDPHDISQISATEIDTLSWFKLF